LFVCLPPAISIAGVFGGGYALVGVPHAVRGVWVFGVAGCLGWVALFFLLCLVGVVAQVLRVAGGVGLLPLLVRCVAGSRGTGWGFRFALLYIGGLGV